MQNIDSTQVQKNRPQIISKFITLVKSNKIRALALSKIEAIIIWIIIFLLSEILISGGRHPFDPFLFGLNIAVIIVLFGYVNIKRPTKIILDALQRAGIAVVVYALLDFLIINLFLEKNNLAIYKTWQTYVIYAVIILIPLALSRLGKKRFSQETEIPAEELQP